MKYFSILIFILLVAADCRSQSDRNFDSSGLKIKIYSNVLDENRDVFIHLPEDYRDNNKSYPLLFILDGDFLPVFYEAISASSYLHYFEGSQEFIVVGVSTRKKRDRYFIPENDMDSDQKNVNTFREFLTSELLSFLEEHYRVNGFRVLYGGSNGGLFAIYTFLTRPGVFNGIIASSPTIGHCSKIIYHKCSKFLQNRSKEIIPLYFNHGGTDTPRTTDHLPAYYTYLKEALPAGYPVAFEIIRNQGHVPFGSIFAGLNYILSSKTNQ